MKDDPFAVNKQTFQNIAEIYAREWRSGLEYQTYVLAPFEEKLREMFQDPMTVLDVGCGVGPSLYLLTKHGFRAIGIDFSSRMCKYARRNASQARVIEGDFFEMTVDKKVQGVLLDEFIHLIPPEYLPQLFEKVRDVLVAKGVCFVGSKAVQTSEEEGGYDVMDRQGNYLYRRFLTEDELRNVAPDADFELLRLERVHCQNQTRQYVLFQKKET